jgi:hypothetical protein
MTLRGSEGFSSVEQRPAKGLARGVLAPNTRAARLRWICLSCKIERSTSALKQIGAERWPLANDHLWYPSAARASTPICAKRYACTEIRSNRRSRS